MVVACADVFSLESSLEEPQHLVHHSLCELCCSNEHQGDSIEDLITYDETYDLLEDEQTEDDGLDKEWKLEESTISTTQGML